MQDSSALFEQSFEELSWPEWIEATRSVTDEYGYTEELGPRHAAVFLEHGKTLLVSFEAHYRIEDVTATGHPLGWQLVQSLGWSHLCLASETDTWFREPRVFGFFDRLIDDGFFEDFDRVIFYGAGSCGYAAAAFSVAAPGARVLAIQPQATLDPRVAEWDDRFLKMRRVAFDDRYGYAPDMLDAAEHAFLLYDPELELDAMHAALFTRSNVTKFRMRHLGKRIDSSLVNMKILLRLLAQLSSGKLNRLSIAKLYRARRSSPEYQFNLLRVTTREQRHKLVVWLAQAVLKQRRAPKFRRAMQQAENMLAAD